MLVNTENIYKIILAVLAEEATEEERAQLQAWLNMSEQNMLEFKQIERIYHLSEKSYTPTQKDFDVERAWMQVQQRITKKRRHLSMRYWLPYAAASLIGILFIIGGLYFIPQPISEDFVAQQTIEHFKEPTLLLEGGQQISLKEDSFLLHQNGVTIRNNKESQLSYKEKEQQSIKEITWNRLVIPKGNAYELILADGTQVWLNAESELSYPTRFTGNTREVKLKGEAYFKVTKNAEQPFIVKTKEIDIRVLGTSFNVAAYQTDLTTSVTLVEGSVAVSTENGECHNIVPSEQFSYHKNINNTSIKTVDTNLYTSWMQGKYIFKDATLHEIFNKLAHWYDFTVEYRNEELQQKRYSLVIDRTINLHQLLELISYTSDVKMVQLGRNIIVEQEKQEKP